MYKKNVNCRSYPYLLNEVVRITLAKRYRDASPRYCVETPYAILFAFEISHVSFNKNGHTVSH